MPFRHHLAHPEWALWSTTTRRHQKLEKTDQKFKIRTLNIYDIDYVQDITSIPVGHADPFLHTEKTALKACIALLERLCYT